MALLKTYTNELGIAINYFRIAQITQNYINTEPIIDVYMYGYADIQYREEEKQIADNDTQKIIFFEHYLLSSDDSLSYNRGSIYARLKNEIEFFNGSIDI